MSERRQFSALRADVFFTTSWIRKIGIRERHEFQKSKNKTEHRARRATVIFLKILVSVASDRSVVDIVCECGVVMVMVVGSGTCNNPHILLTGTCKSRITVELMINLIEDNVRAKNK